MKLLDTNILIYAGKTEYAYLRSLLTDTKNVVSVISKVESLGFHGIQPEEKRFLKGVFTLLSVLPISDKIVKKTIEVRFQNRMKLGDAFIAATAIIHNCPFYTRNTKDFKNIEGLEVINPINP